MPLIGVVTPRKCPTCGHHEMGLTTEDGAFHAFKPGALIQILDDNPIQVPGEENHEETPGDSFQAGETEVQYRPWVPDPLKGDRALRLKYGVMVKEDLDPGQMNGKIFEAAYIEKLRRLIERETFTPIAVILDRFFVSPHLASGNPRQIALNMWVELEEVRRPVELVKAWLESPNEERLMDLIRPGSSNDLGGSPAGRAELKDELKRLSLEEFLDLL